MSDMQPRGIAVEIDGVERRILFTLSAVDKIQAKYNEPVSSVLGKFDDEMEKFDTLAEILLILINDEIERKNSRAGKSQHAGSGSGG